MNYRRGLQRLYAVLALVWVALVLAASIRDRPRGAPNPAPERDSAKTADPVTYDFTGAKFVDTEAETNVKYWLARLAIGALPALGLYFSLFVVVPWIAQGFKVSNNS